MSGPAKTPHWPTIARALEQAGCTLTPYGRSLALATPETAAEDCRNALAILSNRGGMALEESDIAAVEVRLWSAIRKLEA
jgi:hypothetical protein